MSPKQHETVGHYFKAHGDVYLCIRYLPRTGFFMRCIEKGQTQGLLNRAVGEVVDVSERAIGRTYHRIIDGAWGCLYEAHEPPCACYVCVPRD